MKCCSLGAWWLLSVIGVQQPTVKARGLFPLGFPHTAVSNFSRRRDLYLWFIPACKTNQFTYRMQTFLLFHQPHLWGMLCCWELCQNKTLLSKIFFFPSGYFCQCLVRPVELHIPIFRYFIVNRTENIHWNLQPAPWMSNMLCWEWSRDDVS